MEVLREISILWSFIHIMILYMILAESRLDSKKNWIVTICCMLPFIVLTVVLMVVFGVDKMTRGIIVTLTIPSLIFFFITAKHRDGRFLFTFCFADTISFAIIALTRILDHTIGGDKIILMFVLRLLFFPVLEYFVIKGMRKSFLEMQRSFKKGWGFCALVALLFYILLYALISFPSDINNRPEDFPVVFLVFAIMSLTYVAIFRVLRNQQKMYEAEEQWLNAGKQAELLQNELDTEKEYVVKAKQLSHDMRHNYKIVLSYLTDNNIEKAKEYLSQYGETVFENQITTYCDNEIMNAVLRINERRCKKEGVSFNVRVVFPEKLPYTSIETATLFGNLLENAADAASECEGGFINISAEMRNGSLFVEMRNSIAKPLVFENDIPLTTKKGGGGIGIKSSKKILEKYDGILSLKQEGDVFVARIIQEV